MLTYVEVRALARRTAIEPAPEQGVQGILLVATEAALHYSANQSHYGADSVDLYPAVYRGDRCWLRRAEWQATGEYSAYGTSETILSFEDGVKLFLEREVFAFPVPDTSPVR